MKAMDKQVAGSHYKDLKIQPVQIAYQIGATPLWLKAAKYLTREKEDKREDAEKALHCIELEDEMLELRCSKYIAEMVAFDHPEIKAFAQQFDDWEFINDILQKMYFGFYPQAIQIMEEALYGDAK